MTISYLPHVRQTHDPVSGAKLPPSDPLVHVYRVEGAVCTQVGIVGWAAVSEKDSPAATLALARDICASCPVKDACLDMALDPRIEQQGYRSLVWGGMTPRERDKEYRRRYPNGLCERCSIQPRYHNGSYHSHLCENCRMTSRANADDDGAPQAQAA